MKYLSKETIAGFSERIKGALTFGFKAQEASEIIMTGETDDFLAGQSTLQAMKERADLATIVYDAVIDGTESFEDENIGVDLAYLLGAIVKNNFVEWEEKRLPALNRILEEAFVKEHPVWTHIAIFREPEEGKAS